MKDDYDMLTEQYAPTVPVGWFMEHTDLRTVSPHVATESDIWIVYDVGDEPVAMALVEDADARPARLHRLGVQEAYQREGIATAMVERLLDEYGTLKCECRVSLPANDFYKATGWRRVGCNPAEPEDLVQWLRTPEGDDGP